MPTIARRRFVRRASINWSHPLAQGLVCYVLPGVAPVDLSDGQILTVETGTVARGVSPAGPAGVFASARYGLANLSRFAIASGGGLTMFAAVYKPPGANATGNLVSIRATTPILLLNASFAGASPTCLFRIRTNASSLVDASFTGATSEFDGFHTYAATVANGAMALHMDGTRRATGTNSGAVSSFTAGGIGSDSVSGGGTSAYVPVAAVWNRGLSVNEVAALHADPFCMLKG